VLLGLVLLELGMGNKGSGAELAGAAGVGCFLSVANVGVLTLGDLAAGA